MHNGRGGSVGRNLGVCSVRPAERIVECRDVTLDTDGRAKEDILHLYPYLESEDIDQALTYAAWRVEEIDLPLVPA